MMGERPTDQMEQDELKISVLGSVDWMGKKPRSSVGHNCWFSVEHTQEGGYVRGGALGYERSRDVFENRSQGKGGRGTAARFGKDSKDLQQKCQNLLFTVVHLERSG